MIKNIKLNFPPILNEVSLHDLGKINIVCGKNNSGKSTLLEAIRDKEKRVFGMRFKEEEVGYIFKSTVDVRQWGGFSEAKPKEVYRNILNKVSAEREVWYQTDFRIFVDLVINYVSKNPFLAGWRFPEAYINGSFTELLTDKLKTVLLPPKRHLELQSSIDTNIKPIADGKGILNYLFYAANQFKGSQPKVIFDTISEAFGRITGGYSFHISTEAENKIRLSFAYSNKNWIYAEGCGLGLQDLLIILVFAILPDYKVVLIEEPESHLHPDMQKKLLSFLRNETDKQFFISTHSNIFLNNAYIDRVFFTKFDDVIHVYDESSRAYILDDLGYSVAENLVSDLVILVEGPSDIPVIEEFLIKLGLYDKYDIKMWPLGGDIMAQLDLSVFAERYKLIALIDRDPKSREVRKKFQDRCNEFGIPLVQLQRYALENYFTLDALKRVYGPLLSDSITSIVFNKKLEDQIGFNPKKSNRLIAKEMSIADIEGTDLRSFFERVEGMCKAEK